MNNSGVIKMTKSKNKTLQDAKKNKNDEFYTQLNDIAKELKNYKYYFKNKIVYCNCDDPYESNFFKFFALNFNTFKLKKLIATSYSGSPIVGGQMALHNFKGLNNKDQVYKIEITEMKDYNKDGAIDLSDVEWMLKNKKYVSTPLKQGGDFRSDECKKILKDVDIVVTNPPFSLFRDYIEQLVKYKKKFIIVGNTNALTYKEIFKLFKENKIRTGYTNFNVGMFFVVPNNWKKYHHIDNHGNKIARVSTSCWFTNFKIKKNNDIIILCKKYNKKDYPKYDNYNAINVNNINDIPMDYKGVMGVPITFLNKYNPDQFEIIGQMVTTKIDSFNFGYPYINGEKIYARILIKNKKI